MRRRTAWILVAGVAAVAVGAAFVGGLALLLRQGRGGDLASLTGGRSCLTLDVSGDLPEHLPGEVSNPFERRPATVRLLVESLDRAARDPGVRSVLVRVGTLGGVGWGRVQELRGALERFQASGKPAYAHLEIVGNKEYYLATACKKIYAVPVALLGISGLEIEASFYRGALGKLGVEAQFEAIGKYKNAPNTWTEEGFTGPHREQLEALLDGLFGQYVQAIAKSRGLSEEAVREAIDAGPYDGRRALEAGLVDELLYADEVERRVEGEPIAPARYLRGQRGLGFDTRPRLAVVYVVGDIVPGRSQSGVFGDLAGSETVSRAIRDAREDESIKAIVVRVDSPGGVGTAADVMWREVVLARKSKPVVVSMGDLAASGGYYVAMAADAIVAQPGTLTGSIGVFSGKFSLRGLYDKVGVAKEVLQRGEHAALYSEYVPWSDADRAHVRAQNEAFYREFLAKAAQGRRSTEEKIDAVAQGRVWTGEAALQVGLVDRIGGFDDAVALAKERARIPADREVALVTLPARKGFLETLFERQEENPLEGSRLALEWRALLRFGQMLATGQPLARVPFDLRIR